MTDHIKIMHEIFAKYITDKSKKFDGRYVKHESGGTSGANAWGYDLYAPVTLIKYDADGVKIKYHSRFTRHLGDSDIFIDRYVECDGSVLFDEKYGY